MATDAWTDIYPHSGGGRDDLVVEDIFTADASGLLTTDWFLTDDLLTGRVAGKFTDGPTSPALTLEEGQADSISSPRVIKSHAFTITASGSYAGCFSDVIDFTARAYRFVASGAGAGGSVAVTVRKVA